MKKQECFQEDEFFIYPKLDYSITDMQKRNEFVYKIIETIPKEKLTPYYLEQLTKYLTIDPNNKKQKKILTDNRMVTVNKREISFEGLISKLQSGEDGIYNFMTGGDKNIFLVPKIEITEEDKETVPGLKQLVQEIKKLEKRQKAAKGKKKFLLTKQLIEMRQQQYILKSFHKPPIYGSKIVKSISKIELDEKITINEKGEPESNCFISLFNPEHICHLLCNYSEIKQDTWGHFENDLYYLMQDLDDLIEKALKEKYPVLYDIVIYKIDGLTNKEVLIKIQKKYEVRYSVEYLSRLWRKKIPKTIADTAKKEWLIWHYTFEEKGNWKRCSKCHEIKLAHPYFFTKNKTSKDGWYSLCKDCRNKKGQKKIKYNKKF